VVGCLQLLHVDPPPPELGPLMAFMAARPPRHHDSFRGDLGEPLSVEGL
jgi:hypothetical protein